jgi:homocysteine S-methyltransferase
MWNDAGPMISCLHACFGQTPPRVLLLDGATGTELERRGLHTTLPLWTATAPWEATALLQAVHDDYVRAGADLLTACTFRTTHHTLSKCGLGQDAPRITQDAVAIARGAADASPRHVLVAGSIAPLEDCYHPEQTPDDTTLTHEHSLHVEALQRAGVDVLLVETMPTLREARIATQGAIATGLPTIVSLLPGPQGALFDGTPMEPALKLLSQFPIAALSVNCASPERCSLALQQLARIGVPFGAYANASQPDGTFGKQASVLDEDSYAATARIWIDTGASLVGGCCGTSPTHIARLRSLIEQHAPAQPWRSTEHAS